MKMRKLLKTAFLLAFLSFSIGTYAQKQAKLLKSESSVTIKGTSTLHDWEQKVLQFECNLQVFVQNAKLTNVEKGLFKCISKSITSDNSLMDKKTHEALKADAHPELTFIPKSVVNIVMDDTNYSCIVTGDLNIAGVTKNVSIPISGTLKNNHLTIKGSTVVNMPDYGVKPPTALMGSVKTGPKVTISVSLAFLL